MINTASKLIVLGAGLALLAACGGDPDPGAGGAPAQAPQDTAGDSFELAGNADDGAGIYARNCASCHGADGTGQGPAGRALRPPPTDFTAGGIEAAHAYRVVKEGGMAAGLAPTMPPFQNSLNDQEIRDVVAYLLALEK